MVREITTLVTNGFDFYQVLEMPMSVREIFYYSVAESSGNNINWETGEVLPPTEPKPETMQPQNNLNRL